MNLNQFKPGNGEEVPHKKTLVTPRSQARQTALQALYQWQMNCSDILEINKQFLEEGRFHKIDMVLYNEIVGYVVTNSEVIDEVIAPLLDRSVAMIDPIEKTIMRMGVFELKESLGVPYKVIINESVELAKHFGADESHKFVNGILDKVAKDLRSVEVSQKD